MNEVTNTSTEQQPKKNYWPIIIFLIVVLLGAYYVFAKKSQNKVLPVVEKPMQKVDKNALPEFFPKDFPIDVTADLIQDGIKSGSTGRALVVFTSNLTLDQAMSVYTEYFKSHGWKTLQQTDKDYAKTISVKNKAGDVINLNLNPTQSTKTTVSATFIKASSK
jgi:hypothetical protein